MSKDHMHWKHVPLSNGYKDPDNHTKDTDSSWKNRCGNCDLFVHWMHSLKVHVKAIDIPAREHDEICQGMMAVHSLTVTKQLPFSESSRDQYAAFLTKRENWRKYDYNMFQLVFNNLR